MVKKITLYEFKLLPEREQYHLTFTVGQFLDSRISGNQRYALYAVDMFFVEIEYDNENNSIVGKTAFKSGELLNKYSFSSNKI